MSIDDNYCRYFIWEIKNEVIEIIWYFSSILIVQGKEL